MKSDRQIAREAFEYVSESHYVDEDGRDQELVELAVLSALRKYRAQVALDDMILAEAASCWAAYLTDEGIPKGTSTAGADYLVEERDEVQAALGRFLDRKGM